MLSILIKPRDFFTSLLKIDFHKWFRIFLFWLQLFLQPPCRDQASRNTTSFQVTFSSSGLICRDIPLLSLVLLSAVSVKASFLPLDGSASPIIMSFESQPR